MVWILGFEDGLGRAFSGSGYGFRAEGVWSPSRLLELGFSPNGAAELLDTGTVLLVFEDPRGVNASACGAAVGDCDTSNGLGLDADACRDRVLGFGGGFGVSAAAPVFCRMGLTMASLPLAPFQG
jgi:hypothetical protein